MTVTTLTARDAAGLRAAAIGLVAVARTLDNERPGAEPALALEAAAYMIEDHLGGNTDLAALRLALLDARAVAEGDFAPGVATWSAVARRHAGKALAAIDASLVRVADAA